MPATHPTNVAISGCVGEQPHLNGECRRAPTLAALRAAPRVVKVPPPVWATSSLTPAQAKGIRYEKRVGEWLRKTCAERGWELWDHQWFCHQAGELVTYFQPDFIIERPQGNILAEIKLTYVDTTAQLQRYVDCLRVFGLICNPITIVRNLTPNTPSIVTELDSITPNSVLHLWL